MERESTIACGAFELIEPVGEGGMATVWRGYHRRERIPVAVKFVKRLSGATRERLEQFRHEARAHAGLEHPSIVRLLDFGEVDDGLEAASEGALRAGTPYLVMEFADEGTFGEWSGPADWPTVRDLLFQLLDALAFAHARDVVHRDIKPDNILRFDKPGGGLRAKLADFGLAHTGTQTDGGASSETTPSAGTPYYMAPEQLRARWRDFGPWTDLYELGAVAWHWLTGAPPFQGSGLLEIASGHMDEPLPDFEPRFAVPDELEAWLTTLLQKAPAERYRRAADAAFALRRLESSAAAPAGGAPADGRDDDAQVDGRADTQRIAVDRQPETVILPDLADTAADLEAPEPSAAEPSPPPTGESAAPAHRAAPPVPETWRERRRQFEPPLPVVGAGLGLFDLREVPFVDRDAERSAIWEALRRVDSRGRPRLVGVAGGSGTGKSRLVQWTVQRAHETGACTLLYSTHERQQGPSSGLAGAVERRFLTSGLDRGETYERLRDRLGEWFGGHRDADGEAPDAEVEREAALLTEFIRPTQGEPAAGPRVRLRSKTEIYAMLTRLAERLSRRRPLVVWLDDIQWGADALGWIEYLLAEGGAGGPSPRVLFVATARTDVDLPVARRNLERFGGLVEGDESRRVELTALSSADHRRFVDRLLALEDRLAESVRRRTEGNPLFAVQLVGSWVEEGLLESGPDGFGLADGADAELPDAIHELWRRRVDRVLAALEADQMEGRRALELAAALGRHVDAREWRAACETGEIELPDGLVDALLSARLLEAEPGGFSFVHRMLVESLERIGRRAGRWADAHRICAAMLARSDRGRAEERDLRRAEHFEAAGDLERAIAVIGRALPRLRGRLAYGAHERALARRADLMDAAGLPDDDPRRLHNRVERATLHLNRDIGRADELARRAESKLRDREMPVELGRALLVRSAASYWQGDRAAADAILGELETLVDGLDDDRLRGRVAYQRSYLAVEDGRLEESEASIDRAAEAFRRAGDPGWRWRAELRRFPLYVARDDFETFRAEARELLAQADRAGNTLLEAVAHHFLGRAHLREERWERAAEHLDRAIEFYRRIGDEQDLAKARLGRTEAALHVGDFAAAAAQIDRLGGLLDAGGFGRLELHLDLLRAWLAAARRQWQKWDAAVDRIAERAETLDQRRETFARIAERAADLADDAGEGARAAEIRAALEA